MRLRSNGPWREAARYHRGQNSRRRGSGLAGESHPGVPVADSGRGLALEHARGTRDPLVALAWEFVQQDRFWPWRLGGEMLAACALAPRGLPKLGTGGGVMQMCRRRGRAVACRQSSDGARGGGDVVEVQAC